MTTTPTLRSYAATHRCTLLRACREILTANHAYHERCPNGNGQRTVHPVGPESNKLGLEQKAAAYLARKRRQFEAGMRI